MGIPQVFGDAGTSIVGFFVKNRRLQWLPGWILIASIVLRVLSQERLFPHMKEAKGLVKDIQSYVPFVMKYGVPIIDFLIVIFPTTLFVCFFLMYLSSRNLSLPVENWACSIKRWAEVSLVLMLPTCVLYASLLIFASVADINQALTPGYYSSWLYYVLFYLYAFLCHMFNSIHSWSISTDSNKMVVGASATGGGATVALADRNPANQYIERSDSINSSMRDQFSNNLNEGQAYLHAVAIGQGYESADQWIKERARDQAIREAQSIKRENRDLGSSHE